MVITKVRDKLGSLCIICSLGQVKFLLDKYTMAIYLSLGTYKFLLSYDVPSGSEITPCNKIDTPLVVCRFSGNYMMSIMTKL